MRRYELMLVLRPDLPDDKVQAAIVEAAAAFEAKLDEKWTEYRNELATNKKLVPTERRVEQEMHL